MGTVRLVPFDQVAPGDVAFDLPRSAYGRLVQLTTREAIAHCFVYHQRLGTMPDGRTRWLIGEMSARRGAVLTEHVDEPVAVVRVWRLPSERDRLLAWSGRVVEAHTPYDWPEVARILFALTSGRVLDRGGREVEEGELGRAICVAHVLQAILVARPDLAAYLPSPGEVVWPGRLLELLQERAQVPVAPTISDAVLQRHGLHEAA